MEIPNQVYALIGLFVLTNVGTLGAFMRTIVKRETELALMNKNLEIINIQLMDIKLFQTKAASDIHEAHAKIREIKAELKQFDHN